MENYVQVAGASALGEGPHWDVQRQELYYVDINRNYVHRYVPSTGEHYQAYINLGRVGLIVPVAGESNKFILGVEKTLQLMEWNGMSSEPTSLTTLHTVEPGNPNNRFNDGKCDTSGRLWAGTIDQNGGTTANLYRITDTIQVVQTGIGTSNGIAWNNDNTRMYYNDTPTRRVDVFDFNNQEGSISNRKTVYDFNAVGETGSPDGMNIDSDGNLWVACWGGNQVIQINPNSGQKIQSIKFPAKNITSIAFGGPNLEVMYVTSASDGNSDAEKLQQPAAGALFQVTNTGVTGQGGGNSFRL